MYLISTIEHLIQNPIFTLISFTIGVLSLILTVYFFFISRNIKRIFYRQGGIWPIKGKQNERLTLEKLALWNAGSNAIRNTDLVKQMLILKPIQRLNLLSVRIIFCTNNENNLVIENNGMTDFLVIKFDFLNPKDGVIIELIYSGLPCGFESAHFEGNIIDGLPPNEAKQTWKELGYFGSLLVISQILIMIGLGYSGFFRTVMFTLGGLFYPVAMPIVYSWIKKKRVPSSLLNYDSGPPLSDLL